MKYKFRFYLFLLINILISQHSFSQEAKHNLRLGFNYGMGNQQLFPYGNESYNYGFYSYKLLINYPLICSSINFELQVEPSIFSAQHQLLNWDFVQPYNSSNYDLEREIFAKNKNIMEYALNVGILFRFNPGKNFSFSFLASVGPMYSDTKTERMAKGFAFSDILAVGVAYRIERYMFEIRPGVRHVSNADLKQPNNGYNATTIDFGISVLLGL